MEQYLYGWHQDCSWETLSVWLISFQFTDEYADTEIDINGRKGCINDLRFVKEKYPHIKTVCTYIDNPMLHMTGSLRAKQSGWKYPISFNGFVSVVSRPEEANPNYEQYRWEAAAKVASHSLKLPAIAFSAIYSRRARG